MYNLQMQEASVGIQMQMKVKELNLEKNINNITRDRQKTEKMRNILQTGFYYSKINYTLVRQKINLQSKNYHGISEKSVKRRSSDTT